MDIILIIVVIVLISIVKFQVKKKNNTNQKSRTSDPNIIKFESNKSKVLKNNNVKSSKKKINNESTIKSIKEIVDDVKSDKYEYIEGVKQYWSSEQNKWVVEDNETIGINEVQNATKNKEAHSIDELQNLTIKQKKQLEDQLNGLLPIPELPIEFFLKRQKEFKKLNDDGVWYSSKDKSLVRFPRIHDNTGPRGFDDWASK